VAAEFTNPSDKKVLIADDDPGVLEFLQTSIQSRGFQVETAMSGPDAINKISETKPDLIILDLMMPGFGGFETLRKLQGGVGAEIPVIIITARRLDELAQQMIRSEAKVEEIIQKPVSIATLHAAVSRVLKTPPPQSSGRFI
jgi:DNA-binding response OmpR family regulator